MRNDAFSCSLQHDDISLCDVREQPQSELEAVADCEMSFSTPPSSPGRRSTSSVTDSTFSDRDVDSPLSSAETVSASLDEYVSAAALGRASFASGDVQAAIEHFDQALNIELQTELECMYDTSLGYVSGLVRREVETRLHQAAPSSGGPPEKDRVLSELERVYRRAETQSERKPTNPRWYLQMGASLCVVGEWEKARLIYVDGLVMCKDKKDIRRALDNLATIEKVTIGSIQPEDVGPPSVYSPEKNMRLRPKRNRALSTNGIKKHVVRKFSTPEKPEHRKSGSIDSVIPLKRSEDRKRSGSLENSYKSHSGGQRMTYTDLPTSPVRKEKTKKTKLLRRPHSGFFSPKQHEPQVPYKDRQAWADTFGMDSAIANGGQDFVPSAVVHMRRLSVVDRSPSLDSAGVDDTDTGVGIEIKRKYSSNSTPEQYVSFRAIDSQRDTIRVDLSDDSELEFD